LVLVMAIELGLIACMGVFNPVLATYQLDQLPTDRVARTLSAWSLTDKAAIAALTGLWGLLAGVAGPRAAIAGIPMLATPFLLPRPATVRSFSDRRRATRRTPGHRTTRGPSGWLEALVLQGL
jgi:hypothetical protein